MPDEAGLYQSKEPGTAQHGGGHVGEAWPPVEAYYQEYPVRGSAVYGSQIRAQNDGNQFPDLGPAARSCGM